MEPKQNEVVDDGVLNCNSLRSLNIDTFGTSISDDRVGDNFGALNRILECESWKLRVGL